MSTDSVTLQAHYLKADRIMLGVIWFLLAYSCGIAAFYGNWAQALVIGGLTAISMTALYLLIPGQRLLRCLIGAAFMVLAALQINQAHGLLEMHFGIFALLAIPTAAANITGNFNLANFAPEAVRLVGRPVLLPATATGAGIRRGGEALKARGEALLSGVVTGKTPMLAARARDRAWAEKGADLRAKLRGINIMQGKGDSGA